DLLAAHLTFAGGVVTLALEGGLELDGRHKERARLTDRLEVAVEFDRASTVAVAEHPLVHLPPQLEHLGALGTGGKRCNSIVERFDLVAHREVLVGYRAIGDSGVDHRHAHGAVPE